MATETWVARACGHVTEGALRLRQPARHLAGSVRSSVNIGAIVVGAYNLLIGSIYSIDPWLYRNVSTLVQTSAGFAFITALMNMALVFGVLIRDDKILKYILCATMAVYLVCAPLSVCTFLGTAICGYFDVPLWEMPRFGMCLLHLGLMYCLLAEVRGDPLPPLPATPPPPPATSDGWLKNNLARAGPPAPLASDEALLKQVHVDNKHSTSGGPAVFSPSSCTTAAPVHPAHPAYPAYPTTPAATSGPPSTSEA